MEVLNLYRACATLTAAINTSGMQSAVKHYHAQLQRDTGLLAAQGRLAQACAHYIDMAGSFDADVMRVVERMHLTELQTESFWSAITGGGPRVDRQRKLVLVYSKILFVARHLPRLLETLRGLADDHGERTASVPDRELFSLILYDDETPASSPDRIARLLDGFELVYCSCASILSRSQDAPELLSITGHLNKSVVFRGDSVTLRASRNVLEVCLARIKENNQALPLETILLQIPALVVLDKLATLGRHSAGDVAVLRQNLLNGAIMMVESGGQIGLDVTLTSPSGGVGHGVFDAIDRQIEDEQARQSAELVMREKQRMLEQVNPVSAVEDNGASNASHTTALPVANGGAVGRDTSDERIDELIMDLNRYYRGS